jgi:hypothetical protein
MSLLLQLLDRHGASLPADTTQNCRTGTKSMEIASINLSLEAVVSIASNSWLFFQGYGKKHLAGGNCKVMLLGKMALA